MNTNEFLKIAHKYLIFRDDLEDCNIPKGSNRYNYGIRSPRPYLHDYAKGSFGGFRRRLEAAAKLATAEGDICIAGQCGSGKRKLAEAIVEARSDNSSITPIDNKTILKEMDVDHAILIHLTKYDESLIRGSEIIELPPIHKRPWDIVPLVVHNLRNTSIIVITYNALDFFIRDIWLGNIPRIEQLVRNAVRKARERSSDIISFDDIRECFPSSHGRNTIIKCDYIIRHRDNSFRHREHLDDKYVPFTAYSQGPIEQDIGRYEIAGYLFAVTFFKKGNRTIMANFDPNTPNPNLYHGLPFPECSPPYKFEELLTKIELYEPPKCRSADMLSIHWLKDERIGRKFNDKIVEFSKGDEILFDVAEMWQIFFKMGILHPPHEVPAATTRITAVKCTPDFKQFQNPIDGRILRPSEDQITVIKMLDRAVSIRMRQISHFVKLLSFPPLAC